jgi:dephospho-CoA kinase
MPLTTKKTQKKRLKKRKAETIIIIKEHIKAEDSPFQEKIARGNRIFDNNPNLLDGL